MESSPPESVSDHTANTSAVRRSFALFKSLMEIAASIAVCFGLVFAVVQILQSNEHDRIQNAVEATSPARTQEFLTAYSNVIGAYRSNLPIPEGDLNYIANVYDNIAILYLRGVADGEIIRRRVGASIKVLLPILKQEHWTDEATHNIRQLADKLGISEKQADTNN